MDDLLTFTFYVEMDLNGFGPCTNMDEMDTGDGFE
jgi:hypothetical protein